ncbi:MAG: phosphate transporter, permease protein PstA [Pseudomonadota bacterium]|jgi:phosphate transport system permease protein
MFQFVRKWHDARTETAVQRPAVIFKTAVRLHSKAAHNATEGVPWIWVCAGALVSILLLIVGLFGIILTQGLSALWPHNIIRIEADNNPPVVGIAMRQEEATDSVTHQKQMRRMVYQANRDFGVNEFAFVPNQLLQSSTRPQNIWFVERLEWGPFLGRIQYADGPSAGQDIPAEEVARIVRDSANRRSEIQRLDKGRLADLNATLEDLRLEKKQLDRKLELGRISEGQSYEAVAKIDQQNQKTTDEHSALSAQIQQLRSTDENIKVILTAENGQKKSIAASQIRRAFQVNDINFIERVGIFLSRLWSFVSEEPREANTEGGVFPALFGTVAMTLLMTVFVLPVGIMSAVYMREIAKQGFLVSLVRIAVNNLAGVPSIVYGVFGVGFFCYSVGSTVDQLFFQEKLPNPTFGTGGILWASLTLALLTVPVVIVSTEEALSAVPRSLREASFGCGATRIQTLWNIVLPKALPGVMTGLILAMARAVGEVAPLLMTGVVKLAPALPVDGHFPYVHLERSFMHLGFHIYDLGFQSRSTEISRPMVFASTCLLVAVVLSLNFVAIKIRSQLRKRFEGRGAF